MELSYSVHELKWIVLVRENSGILSLIIFPNEYSYA